MQAKSDAKLRATNLLENLACVSSFFAYNVTVRNDFSINGDIHKDQLCYLFLI